MKLNSKGAIDMMLVVALVVVVIGASFVAWRVMPTDETVSETAANTEGGSTVPSSQVEESSENEESTVPEGFSSISGEGFIFNYPDSWPESSISYKAVDTGEFVFGFRPVLFYSSQNENWVIVRENPKNPGGEPGSVYSDLEIEREDGDLTIYQTGFGDGGCGAAAYTFRVGDKMATISTPGICTKDASNPDGGRKFVVNDEDAEFTINGTDVYNEILSSISLDS